MKKYNVYLTKTFKEELRNIIKYINNSLKEPNISKKLHSKIIYSIYSLETFPFRFSKLNNSSIINVRKMKIGKYIVIYHINSLNNTVYILHIFHTSQNYLDKI